MKPGPLIALALAASTTCPLQAFQIAADPFATAPEPKPGEYAAASLIGQGPSITGYTGSWLPAFAGAASPDVVTTGLVFPGVPTDGGSINYTNNGRCGRLLQESYDHTFQGSIYISLLMQLNNLGSEYRSFELHWNGFDDSGNRTLQIATGEGSGGIVPANDLALRINNSDANGVSLGEQDAAVNFFVIRIDFSTDANGDSVTVYRNPEDLINENANTGTALSGFDFRFDRTSFARFGDDNLSFDELRVGTTFNDVTGNVNPDSDNDGMDDGWEFLNNLTVGEDDSAGDAEFDNDGLTNLEEFLAGTDPNDADSDDDNVGDADELDGSGNAFDGVATDPVDADSDDDGLNDGEESSDANGFVTNPNSADSDGDNEADAIEIVEGTDPTDANSSSAALGNYIIDGVRDSLYGPDVAVQTVQTGFGDNFGEWNAAYAAVKDGKLYLMFTGNLEENFNKLEIFLDPVPGGTNVLTTAGNDGSDAMNGLIFDADFTPEYHFIVRRGFDGAGKFDLDFANLTTGEFASYIRVFGANTSGRATTGVPTQSTFAVDPGPIGLALDNSNEAGIGGDQGVVADAVAARAVTTGLELCIDFADIGNPVDSMNVMLFQNNGDHMFASNQFLGGLPVGTMNLGSLAGVDLSNFAGDQFFSVEVPAVPVAFTAVSTNTDTSEVVLTWTSTPGATYLVESSADLLNWTEVDDGVGAEQGSETTTFSAPVSFDPTPRLYFRVTRL